MNIEKDPKEITTLKSKVYNSKKSKLVFQQKITP